jgi:lysophospholipase L1-like esterase
MKAPCILSQEKIVKTKIDIAELDRNLQSRVPDENGIVWHVPTEKPFRICGFYWFARDGVFRRLPLKPAWTISQNIDTLADCTAGGQLRFRTDSCRISIRTQTGESKPSPVMAEAGRSGFDLYCGAPGQELFWNATAAPCLTSEFSSELFHVQKRQWRDFVLNFPLYNRVAHLEIGLDADAGLKAPRRWADPRKVVIYGTSITQGGCASRPGMAFTNILSRRLNIEFLNFGFSGNGHTLAEHAHLIASVKNPALFIIDSEANCISAELFRERLPVFIDIIRKKHAQVPILVVSKITYGPRYALEIPADEQKMVQIQCVKKICAAGDKQLYFLDGSDFLGKDYSECSVDGAHPNDLGFYRIAEALEPVIRNILKSNQ